MRSWIFCDCCKAWCIPTMRYLDFVICGECEPHFKPTNGKQFRFRDRKHFQNYLTQVKIDLNNTKRKILH